MHTHVKRPRKEFHFGVHVTECMLTSSASLDATLPPSSLSRFVPIFLPSKVCSPSHPRFVSVAITCAHKRYTLSFAQNFRHSKETLRPCIQRVTRTRTAQIKTAALSAAIQRKRQQTPVRVTSIRNVSTCDNVVLRAAIIVDPPTTSKLTPNDGLPTTNGWRHPAHARKKWKTAPEKH